MRIRSACTPVILLTIHSGMLAYSAWQHSPTDSEPAHLASGVSHWTLGRFDLFRVNPPLVRMVAAVPALLGDVNQDWKQYRTNPMTRTEWEVGADMCRANHNRALWLIRCARWACLPFALLGGATCFVWARHLYGYASGLIALALWCFCPYILGHGSLISPDAHSAALGCFAGYSFWRWLRQATWPLTILCGCSLGLAASSKSTLLILFALWPVLWCVCSIRNRVCAEHLRAGCVKLTAVLGVGVCVINACYLCEGTWSSLGTYKFQSVAATGLSLQTGHSHANRFAGTLLGALPVPLPRDLVQGVDTQLADFDRGMPSFLRGRWSSRGWWHYYLYASTVKLPVGTLALLAIAIGMSICIPRASAAWEDEVVAAAPGLVILAIVSVQSGFGVHSRYMIPMLPFMYAWISKAGRALQLRHTVWCGMAMFSLSGACMSSVAAYPHSLAYFNECVGGPLGGPRHLLGSNVDWGQDLLYLESWLERVPELAQVTVEHSARCGPGVLGDDLSRLNDLQAGTNEPVSDSGQSKSNVAWHVISVNHVWGQRREMNHFRQQPPVSTVGYTMYVYRIVREPGASD